MYRKITNLFVQKSYQGNLQYLHIFRKQSTITENHLKYLFYYCIFNKMAYFNLVPKIILKSSTLSNIKKDINYYSIISCVSLDNFMNIRHLKVNIFYKLLIFCIDPCHCCFLCPYLY